MDTLLQDLRYAVRSLAQAPGFTVVALLTIGIGIGVNTTVFSLVEALMLRHAAGVETQGDLASVFTSDFSSGPYGESSYPDYLAIRAGTSAFERLAAYAEGPPTNMRIGATFHRVRTTAVSGEFFTVLGVRPAVGRAIAERDTEPAAPAVVVIAHALWQRAFGGAASAVGAQVSVDGRAHTVIGVAPEGFTGLNVGALIEAWTPLAREDESVPRDNRRLDIVGRLRRGTRLHQAQAQLDGIAARLADAYPATNRGTLANPDDPRPIAVTPLTRLPPAFRSEVAMVGATLMAAVGLVLMIACANVAGLLLSRATARSREVAVRLALGASRGRLVRQMLTESLLLAAMGGAIGVLFALWTADLLPSYFPAEQAALLDVRINWRVALFTAATAMVSGIVFGLAPAFHGVRASAAGALRSNGERAGDARRTVGVRNVLVVAQIALASVLLVSSALLARSLVKALDADMGFSTRQALLATVELPSTFSAAQGLAYYSSLIAEVNAIPGVERSSVARVVPVAGGSRRLFSVPGYVPRRGEDMELHINTVDRDYFATIGMAAVAGRLFEPADAPDAPVVVVNQVLADRYFAGNAVGRRLIAGRGVELEIIGVVRVARRDGVQEVPGPIVFYQLGRDFMTRALLVAKTSGDPLLVAEALRRRATTLDENVPVFRIMTLEAHLGEAAAANRLTAALVMTCGGLALALATVGVYGIVSFAVARRTREIGVRMALGAGPRQVLGLMIREAGRVIAAGVLLGVAASLAATRLLESMLYGVSATDMATFIAVPAAIAGTALLASCVPAVRALRISPVAALRQD